MNTPKNKPLRVGLSKTSCSITKRSSFLTPTSSSSATLFTINSDSTPTTSLKSTIDKTVITKKKLEFAAQKYLESDKLSGDESEKKLNDLDLESLKMLVEDKRTKLEILKNYQVEKDKLLNVTEKWKEAGLLAIDKLRGHVQEHKTDEEILDSFKIPHEVFL